MTVATNETPKSAAADRADRALKEIGSALETVFTKARADEVAGITILAPLMADYLVAFREANGRVPELKAFRTTINSVERDILGKQDPSGKSGIYARVKSAAIKSAYLVDKGTFRATWIDKTTINKPVEVTSGAKGAMRAVIYLKPDVYPNAPVKEGRETTAVPHPSVRPNGLPNLCTVNTTSADDAFSFYIEGIGRNDFGKPNRAGATGAGQGGTSGQMTVKMDGATDREILLAFLTILKDGKRLFELAATEGNIDTMVDVLAILDTHITADGDFVAVKTDENDSKLRSAA
jgi:hypothetical protein